MESVSIKSHPICKQQNGAGERLAALLALSLSGWLLSLPEWGGVFLCRRLWVLQGCVKAAGTEIDGRVVQLQ